jgi:hypothetical protein
VVAERGWDCAEAAKLEEWEDLFLGAWVVLPPEADKEELARVFEVLGGLRAILVDRKRVGIEEVEGLMRGVEGLAKELGAERQRDGIIRLRSRVDQATRELASAEMRVRDEAAGQLQALAAKRLEVMRLEQEVQAGLNRELGLIQELAKASIERGLQEVEEG